MQSRKLAAILFADIVGYTAIMQRNEHEGLRMVKRFREVLEKKVSELQGEILQYYGDGSLIIFSSGISALQCAKEIQKVLNDKNNSSSGIVSVPLRIGIHIGDIVFKDDSIYGDGVNLASRIESLGIPGSVLFSHRLVDDIKSHPNFQTTSLGSFHFKNVDEPMEIFALANEGFPVPKRSEVKGKLKDKSSNIDLAKWLIPLILVLAVFMGYQYLQKSKTINDDKAIEIAKASIAVLPFEDMSPQKDQEYFADGIAEEILNTLSQLDELKVAGRTSSFSFKNKETTITEIGKALNVDHILEGSVQRQGDKIRITAQLIKVEDGFQVWSKKYNNNFTDIFKIQDSVAQNIGNALLVKLAPEQLSRLKTKTFENSEAYGLFLRAKHIFTNRFRSTLSQEDFKKSEKLFQAAIDLDTNYALAHAGLANLYDTYVFYVLSPDDSIEFNKYNRLRIEESKLAFDLDSTLAYVNEVRGHVLLNSSANLNDVYKSYLKAYELNPKNPDVLLALMDVYVRKGLLKDALKFADEALAIDPLHIWALAWKIYSLGVIGDFDAAIDEVKTALDINPDEIILLVNLASFYSFMGNTKEAMATYEKIDQINPDYLVSNPYYQIKLDLLKGKLDLPQKIIDQPSAAILPIGNVEIDFLSSDMDRFEKSFLAWWEDWKSEKHVSQGSVFIYSQGSIYLHLQNHLMYQSFKNKPWFEKILKEEKDKYGRFLKKFSRPEDLLKN